MSNAGNGRKTKGLPLLPLTMITCRHAMTSCLRYLVRRFSARLVILARQFDDVLACWLDWCFPDGSSLVRAFAVGAHAVRAVLSH